MATAELNQDLAVLGQVGCLSCAQVRVHQLFFGLTVPRGRDLLDVREPASDTFLLSVGRRVAGSTDWERRDGLNNAPRRSYPRQRVAGQVLVDGQRGIPVRGNFAATALGQLLCAVENVD